MIETSGDEYQSSKYAKSLFVGEAKMGKTCFLVAQALGLFPNQKYGGVVDKPENLHVITLDSGALGGIAGFLKKTLGAPDEALKFRAYYMQADVQQAASSQLEYDTSLFNTFMTTLRTIHQRVQKADGVSALLISSVTGIAPALERAIGGPPGVKKQTMDQTKWSEYNRQISEIRNAAQRDIMHTLWEGHVLRIEREGQGGTTVKESIQLRGQSGQNFAYNVEQVFRVKRMFGEPAASGSKCDTVYLDTRPEMGFIVNGRGFTENLDPKEYDLTVAVGKLGMEVGRWQAGAKKVKKGAKS
jgi:hypothetical protein